LLEGETSRSLVHNQREEQRKKGKLEEIWPRLDLPEQRWRGRMCFLREEPWEGDEEEKREVP